jgi:hypothetical protein
LLSPPSFGGDPPTTAVEVTGPASLPKIPAAGSLKFRLVQTPDHGLRLFVDPGGATGPGTPGQTSWPAVPGGSIVVEGTIREGNVVEEDSRRVGGTAIELRRALKGAQLAAQFLANRTGRAATGPQGVAKPGAVAGDVEGTGRIFRPGTLPEETAPKIQSGAEPETPVARGGPVKAASGNEKSAAKGGAKIAVNTGFVPAAEYLTHAFHDVQDENILKILTALTGGRCVFRFEVGKVKDPWERVNRVADIDVGETLDYYFSTPADAYRKLKATCKACRGDTPSALDDKEVELKLSNQPLMNWEPDFNYDPVSFLHDRLVSFSKKNPGVFPTRYLVSKYEVYAKPPPPKEGEIALAKLVPKPLQVGYQQLADTGWVYRPPTIEVNSRCLETNADRAKAEFQAKAKAGKTGNDCIDRLFPIVIHDWIKLRSSLISGCATGPQNADPQAIKDAFDELEEDIGVLESACKGGKYKYAEMAKLLDAEKEVEDVNQFIRAYTRTPNSANEAVAETKKKLCDAKVFACGELTGRLRKAVEIAGGKDCSGLVNSDPRNGAEVFKLLAGNISDTVAAAAHACGAYGEAERALTTFRFVHENFVKKAELAFAGDPRKFVVDACYALSDEKDRLEIRAAKCEEVSIPDETVINNPSLNEVQKAHITCGVCCSGVFPSEILGTIFDGQAACLKRCDAKWPLTPVAAPEAGLTSHAKREGDH